MGEAFAPVTGAAGVAWVFVQPPDQPPALAWPPVVAGAKMDRRLASRKPPGWEGLETDPEVHQPRVGPQGDRSSKVRHVSALSSPYSVPATWASADSPQLCGHSPAPGPLYRLFLPSSWEALPPRAWLALPVPFHACACGSGWSPATWNHVHPCPLFPGEPQAGDLASRGRGTHLTGLLGASGGVVQTQRASAPCWLGPLGCWSRWLSG